MSTFSSLLLDLLPEMLAEVRRWLDAVDRVHLQRVSRQCHARDPGPLLTGAWADLGALCATHGELRALFTHAVAEGLHERAPPSVVAGKDTTLVLRWFRLPVAAMRDGEDVALAVMDDITLSRTHWRYQSSEVTTGSINVVHDCTRPRGHLALAEETCNICPGFAVFYGNLGAMMRDGVFRERYRSGTVSFQLMADAAQDMSSPLQIVYDIPLNA